MAAEGNPPPNLMPALIVRDAKAALRFYEEALGATQTSCIEGPDGKVMHATIELGGAVLMVHDEFPEMGAIAPQDGVPHPVYFYVMVADADAAVERAVAAGATLVRPVETEFYGHRLGVIQDPFGHLWDLATEVEDLSEEELQQRMAAMPEP